MSRRACRRLDLVISLAIIALLAGNLLVFGRIAAGIGQIADRIAHVAVEPAVPVPGPGATAPLPPHPHQATAIVEKHSSVTQ